jgi:tRNA modification GTPase
MNSSGSNSCLNPGPIVALLTPAGRGAVATIGVRGPGAVAVVERCIRPAAGRPFSDFPTGRIVFGTLVSDSRIAEELVVAQTGPDEVEIHCHGGQAASQAVIGALLSHGCRHVDWPAWQDGKSSAIQAEALVELSSAVTERTAAILLDQRRGALDQEIRQIAALVERADVARAGQSLRRLVERGQVGLRLTRRSKVVLAGPPNVGKSSLINALLGYERSIVFDQPGTTRDALTAAAAIDGWPVELSDTAGLRQAQDPIEREGIARAQRQIAAADLLLIVQDAATPPIGPKSVPDELQDRSNVLIVHNKCDLLPSGCRPQPPGLAVSALTGQGIEDLCQAISDWLVPNPPSPGQAVPFLPRHIELLAAGLAQLEAGNVRGAAETLAKLQSGAGA